MHKRCLSVLGIFIVLLAASACTNKKVSNPIAQVDSKQPDKILFDRAMDAMKHNRFDVARLTLQTLINTYPDSEFVARAKLAVGDSWYAEGGSAAMTQAENEYKDFITFFPNMPEAAEAQLKIANIHFREMEKPDRDFTHAMRAEEEYRNLLTQFPDSKLVPEAKQRLLQVQEVLAEREYRIGRFYFMRESYNAAVARLNTLVDTYPLYSSADDALFMLGIAYQRQADNFRLTRLMEQAKAQMVKQREDLAAAAFSRIITRYPVTERAEDAKRMLEAMHRPVPTPTPEAIAQNKAEEASRGETGLRDRLMGSLHKGPSEQEALAVKVGEPTLTDPKQTGAPDLLRQANSDMEKAVAQAINRNSGGNKISVQAVPGAPLPNEAPPRSDQGALGSAPAANDPNAIPELKPVAPENASDSETQNQLPPTQINEVQNSSDPSTASSSSSSSSNSNNATAQPAQSGQQDKADSYSTSKQKKKKGLHKLNPF
ncbi:MAG TPA: outer membrane protein assembly factor BamD [Terriglobales bacterium]|nr:outer membrane protein assembly factor BamD [Terriglobales bacterium]